MYAGAINSSFDVDLRDIRGLALESFVQRMNQSHFTYVPALWFWIVTWVGKRARKQIDTGRGEASLAAVVGPDILIRA